MLILRGSLNSAPRLEYDVIASQSWSGRTALAEAAHRKWKNESIDEFVFLAPSASSAVSSKGAVTLLETAQKIHPTVWRLAIRREFPQLELHIPLPNPTKTDARQFFEAVRTLAQQTTGNHDT
jgi:hypothetical protein